jgi:hypothetical protein
VKLPIFLSPLWLLAALGLIVPTIQAQTNAPAPAERSGDLIGGNGALVKRADEGPIDISAQGETTYDSTPLGRIATATGSVTIQTTDASIYSDYAEYNVDTHEALLVGNVRIYRTDTVILSERAIYNFDTKAIRSLAFQGSKPPYDFSGLSLFSPGAGAQYNLRQSAFTTHDSSKPDYVLKSKRVRIYPDDRIVYIGTTLYIGKAPILYLPYFYQSLDQQSGYTVSPGYTSEYGAYLLLGLTFPVTEKITGLARFDYRFERGPAAGLTFTYKPQRKAKTRPDGSSLPAYASDDDPSQAAVVTAPAGSPTRRPGGVDDNSAGNADGSGRNSEFAATGEALSRQIRKREGAVLETYYALDAKPDLNRTSLDRLPVDPQRYRFALKQTQYFSDDLSLRVSIDKVSDRYLLQDFFQSEFTRDPNPDNVGALTYQRPGFVATVLGRAQFNEFFDTTSRLPEVSLEIVRQPLLDTGLFYEGENNIGYLRRSYDEQSPLISYSSYRFDTFHQITLPKTYFGWLSVVPRLGVRGTYYSRSAPEAFNAFELENLADDSTLRTTLALNPNDSSLTQQRDINAARAAIKQFVPGGGIFRPVVNTGVEASFKVSRVYDEAQSRLIGLDKLQHIIQPYTDVSVTEDFGVGSRQLLAFDRRLPTTQLDPIQFPQFTSTDSIDEQSVVRVGVRNRLQTKRDALTFNWLELDSFFQANINNPTDRSAFSNFFNQVTFRPLPLAFLTLDSQLPILDHGGFTEINTTLNLQVTSNTQLQLSHRYLDNNPFFQNSSLMQLGGYFRLDDNWAFSFAERYEFADKVLEGQSYTLYRDLTSFVASIGMTVRDNRGVNDYGLLVNFTLKGVPKVSLPVGFDVQSLTNEFAQ